MAGVRWGGRETETETQKHKGTQRQRDRDTERGRETERKRVFLTQIVLFGQALQVSLSWVNVILKTEKGVWNVSAFFGHERGERQEGGKPGDRLLRFALYFPGMPTVPDPRHRLSAYQGGQERLQIASARTLRVREPRCRALCSMGTLLCNTASPHPSTGTREAGVLVSIEQNSPNFPSAHAPF